MLSRDFLQLKWALHADNPLIRPPFPSPLIADPTLIVPAESPDGQWHLFAHSILGIHHYTSQDGIRWHKGKRLVTGALRPFIFQNQGVYYLYFEQVGSLNMALAMLPLRKWHSCISVISSNDLLNWSAPEKVLLPDMAYAQEPNGAMAVSNPCMVKEGEEYLLYFSAGLVHVPDCGFNEPRFIGLAKGKSPKGPFTPSSEPIIIPDAKDRWNNLGAGSMKVIRVDDGWVAFQNGIYAHEGKSGSAIRLLFSTDGIQWSQMSDEPLLAPSGNGWMASHIYACDIRQHEGEWRLYFNARTAAHWTKGKEAIGVMVGNTR